MEQADLTRKISGLLAKAQSTEFEAEAQTFYNAAQQLMRKYAIEEADLWKAGKKDETPIIREFVLGSQRTAGVEGIRTLLYACASFNRCKMWYTTGTKSKGFVAGFKSDVDYVELLFNSLRVFGDNAEVWASLESNEHHRTFTAGFWQGFAGRIWIRLRENEKSDPTSTALVLRDRKEAVDKYLADQGMRFGKGQTSSNQSRDGQTAGAKAGSEASLNIRESLGSQKEIGK